MAGNRTELILSMIAKAISDVEEGMEQSCSIVQDSLLMRVNDLKNRQERTSTKCYDVNLDFLRRKTTPLLQDVDKELTYKKRYANLAVLNIKAHYGYACIALRQLVNSLKVVILDNYNDVDETNKPVIAVRPHALGAIRPPYPSEVISSIQERLKSLNMIGCLDSATVTAALESIAAESDDFHRENAINNAFDVTAAEEDLEPTSRVVTLFGDTRRDMIKDVALNGQWTKDKKGLDTVISSLVSRRPAQYGVEWRPPASDGLTSWRYPFENLWGDNKITLETVSTLLSKAIIPNIELSSFLLYMCNHIRAVIKSMRVILFDKREAYLYFEDKELSDWTTWTDLYNKLEWFMLLARYIIFIYSEKETFLDGTAGLTHGESDVGCNPVSLLAAATESIPPNLMSKDWVQQNLLSWPSTTESSNIKAEALTEETILCLALRTSPGAMHPVFEVINESDYPITNRLSIDSAKFCIKVLLGRALEEEDAGTKMLVESQGDRHSENSSQGKSDNNRTVFPLGVLPVEEVKRTAEVSRVSDINNCTAITTASPYIASPTYLLRKAWSMESSSAGATVKREAIMIASAVLANTAPLMFDTAAVVPGKEWACLKMLGCCQAPNTIHNVWLTVLRRQGDNNVDDDAVSEVLAHSKKVAGKLCEKERERHELRKRASTSISSFLSGAVSDIQEANRSSSLAAENALWATSVWKKATAAVLTRLASFPDQK